MRYLTTHEIVAINTFVIQQFSPNEQTGIKDSTLLKSATFRPQTTLLEKDAYPTLYGKAAALFQSLAQNHAFFNGNKRTAFTFLIFFLRYNGYHFEMPTQEKIEFTVDVVKHRYALTELSQIIEEHVVKIEE